MEATKGVSQLFIKRRGSGKIAMLLAKITDELIFAGSIEDMNYFVMKIKRRFSISKGIIGRQLFNGCMINKSENWYITMDLFNYMKAIQQLQFIRARRKQAAEKALEDEYADYISLAGSVIRGRNCALPYTAFVGRICRNKHLG